MSKDFNEKKKQCFFILSEFIAISYISSLTIVEERIQPSHISQEVEHLNDEIFQHLVEFEKTMLEAGSPKTLQRMPKSNGILKPLSLKTEIMTNEYNQRTEKR